MSTASGDSRDGVAGRSDGAPGRRPGGGRTTPLRVDAQRNLEHVLRAAREVFGELGYGAPMEDVARRARVGVGTVYRRFPSKDVLVRRIAEAETARLTEQARTALSQEDEPWPALSRFLRTSVASGAGRLLPPQVLRVGVATGTGAQRREPGREQGEQAGPGQSAEGSVTRQPEPPERASARERDAARQAKLGLMGLRPVSDDGLHGSGVADLLEVVGRLVDRARAAGELRAAVTVADVLLVIATAAPSLPDAAQQQAASERLLDILLEGLRSRPAL